MTNINNTAIPRAVVLISGRGSNLNAIIQAKLPMNIVGVVSNRKKATGLKFATNAGIVTKVVDETIFEKRDSFDQALLQGVASFSPHLVILAGFMRILNRQFINTFNNSIVNIHPSLLPNFKGLNTHKRVLDASANEHGVSVHYVDDLLDNGEIILQEKVVVLAQDTPESLAERVLELEHRLYPTALRIVIEKWKKTNS